MTKRQAFNEGYNAGYGAALHCEVDNNARREAACNSGCTCIAPAVCEECLTRAAYDAEMGARDFSPWEFIASAINKSAHPDRQWSAYDRGVARGIYKGLATRMAKMDWRPGQKEAAV